MTPHHILAIDAGTSSIRAIVYDRGVAVHTAQQEVHSNCDARGWVEQDPADLWEITLDTCRRAISGAGLGASDILAIGITNQRETTIVWDRANGMPIYPAIVWQDRRTADHCAYLAAAGVETVVSQRTGLLVDPYFSATKLQWILQNCSGARARADRGELAFGTVDSWLLWKLTNGAIHATDATNASRTMLFNIQTQQWDEELLRLFDVPASVLPIVLDSADDYGSTAVTHFGYAIPIRALIGDQQAALVGQACIQPGSLKSTYGTGCFLVMNTGDRIVRSSNRLLTTIAYRIRGKTTYAIEGSIFVAGAAVQWLRDNLRLIETSASSEILARAANPLAQVYFVPAFTGLGAPYWDPNARGAITGLSRDTGIAEIIAAGLRASAYQTRDILESIANDGVLLKGEIRIDGGMASNDWFAQSLADLLGLPVQRPLVTETTALGAALIAGMACGLYDTLEEAVSHWQSEDSFVPQLRQDERDALYAGWRRAVRQLMSSSEA